jgi:coenzyme F420-reducing hydrogenase delta subunit
MVKSAMNSDYPVCITILYCENSVIYEEIERYSREEKNFTLRTISLPCSGKVDISYLIKAIETGADGVLLITCKTGECHYLQGNLRARKRVEAVDSLLKETGMGNGFIRTIEAKESNEPGFIVKEIEAFKNRVLELKKEGIQVTGDV